MRETISMQYRNLGRCGLKLSALSLGGWTTFGDSVTDQGTITAIIAAAYSAGINFFDMADAYARGESERAMGAALRQFPRHTLVLSSKLFRPMSDDINDRGLSRKHIMESIDKSLTRIGTDYLDIYLCHRDDPETPVEETVRAMDDLVRAGKILYWGTSEWPLAKLDEARRIAGTTFYRPQVEQPQYNLLNRRIEEDLAAYVVEHGVGLTVYGPLASGLLTGKYDDGIPEGSRLARLAPQRERWYRAELVERVRRFRKIADDLGTPRAAVAIAWLLTRPGVSTVITGATNPDQLRSNLQALTLQLPPAVLPEIDDILPGPQTGPQAGLQQRRA
jgi:voltage-dependent potassium channel beta subunit